MSSNIYTEALSEAKKLREVAEQNAKNAIIEAVTPKIREFIDNQLMETEDFKDESVEDLISEAIGEKSKDNESELNMVELDESALTALSSIMGGGNSEDVLTVLAESINSLSEDQADLVRSAAQKISSKNKSFSSQEIDNDVINLQENNTMPSDEKVYEVDLALLKEELKNEMYGDMQEEDDSERDADDTSSDDDGVEEGSTMDQIREVLSDLGLLNEDKIEIDLGDDVELPEDIMLTARLVAEEEAGDEDLDVEDDEVMDIEDDELDADLVDAEESLDEVFDIDPNVLREELARIKRLVREAKSLSDAKGGADSKESSFGGAGHANAGQKHQFGGKAGKKGSAFGGGSEKGDVFKVKLNALSETLKKEQRKNLALQERLEEYRSAVETLREQLTDLNLFNAKLLYVNKLFQDKSVNPTRRRKSMVESIDSAKSLREVKLIYKTLTSGKLETRSLNESRHQGHWAHHQGLSADLLHQPTLKLIVGRCLAGIKK